MSNIIIELYYIYIFIDEIFYNLEFRSLSFFRTI